ncbi:DUF4839 domain-containing protein [Planococcus versutus]|uniref:DUF4839 domain-containing protein n=1 Tax=Planococcus versutus TaxID=1302659 RepID=A0A1B1RZB7_9BACL|nr:DUF4839 domain-containing protein [Planococcus versutus]ANU26282.1 hypothetical protein I858_004450 [Planococcus versutus]
MKKTLLFLSIMVSTIGLSACSEEKDPNVLKVSNSSDDIVGENYESVISELEEIGFTNIETKILDDLITGWLTKDGEIEKVDIDGKTEFSAQDDFQKDSKIVITYHTFEKEETNTNQKSKETNVEKVEEPTTDTSAESNKEETSTTDKVSPEKDKQVTSDKPAESSTEILTANNNEELAVILALKDTTDPKIAEFAKKYAGRTIEFDGYIANMMPHGKYKTRYDILINVGDYRETNFSGPDFKFDDVGMLDLNLTGSEIPDTIGYRQNLFITAIVDEYDENPGLFFIKPISTEIR